VPGPERLPSGVDVTTPNLARVYDYMLGGKDNFAADRQAADTILSAVPQMRAIALENRRFLIRAVRFCAQAGIRQFIDIGAGLPTQDNVHQVAQRADPGARVVYADNDGVVVSHGLALLAEDDQTTVVHADLLRPADLLAHPGLRGLIDLSQPVGLLVVALLHFIPDDGDPMGALASLRDALAPGSYLVLSHAEFSPDHVVERQPASEQTRRLREAYRRPTGVARSRDELAAFFGDFEIVEPGLTEVWNWRPDSESVINPSDIMAMVGGVARKP
jgi:SAM-dependent methyltransferase